MSTAKDLLAILEEPRDFDIQYLCMALDISDRVLRKFKEELLEKKIPIGSHVTRGYFYIRNNKDRNDAKIIYREHTRDEERKMRLIDEAYDETYLRGVSMIEGQGSLL